VEAQRKVSEDICRQVSDFLLKKAVLGALNFPQLDAGQVERYQHFVDLAGRMASFIGQIADGRIQSVALRYSGEVCDMNLNYLTSVVVQRLLERSGGVNLINAPMLRGCAASKSRRLVWRSGELYEPDYD
jgi:D-3-phosphoglycerate dehydrogenase